MEDPPQLEPLAPEPTLEGNSIRPENGSGREASPMMAAVIVLSPLVLMMLLLIYLFLVKYR